jgi:hypothetical protein
MLRQIPLLLALVVCLPAWGLSPEAKEFMQIARQLEPVHCEKRKLRREMALAEAEGSAARTKELRARFAELDRNPATARLEKRLAELERRMTLLPGDLDAISFQQREAYHRCE